MDMLMSNHDHLENKKSIPLFDIVSIESIFAYNTLYIVAGVTPVTMGAAALITLVTPEAVVTPLPIG